MMENAKQKFKKQVMMSLVVTFTLLFVVGIIGINTVFAQEVDVPAEEELPDITANRADVMKFAFIGAAVAFGFGAIGAGIAIANVGSAAMAAVAEKPQIAGQALIFIALAEGLVVFGFIAALMILGKV
ncbi:MAG: ATP synthase subunit C [Spirochaetia bacterium]